MASIVAIIQTFSFLVIAPLNTSFRCGIRDITHAVAKIFDKSATLVSLDEKLFCFN